MADTYRHPNDVPLFPSYCWNSFFFLELYSADSLILSTLMSYSTRSVTSNFNKTSRLISQVVLMKWFFEVIEKKRNQFLFEKRRLNASSLFPFNVGHILLLSHSLFFSWLVNLTYSMPLPCWTCIGKEMPWPNLFTSWSYSYLDLYIIKKATPFKLLWKNG